jgi:hypothetical protein
MPGNFQVISARDKDSFYRFAKLELRLKLPTWSRANYLILLYKIGGRGNRTPLDGFANRCLASRPYHRLAPV